MPRSRRSFRRSCTPSRRAVAAQGNRLAASRRPIPFPHRAARARRSESCTHSGWRDSRTRDRKERRSCRPELHLASPDNPTCSGDRISDRCHFPARSSARRCTCRAGCIARLGSCRTHRPTQCPRMQRRSPVRSPGMPRARCRSYHHRLRRCHPRRRRHRRCRRTLPRRTQQEPRRQVTKPCSTLACAYLNVLALRQPGQPCCTAIVSSFRAGSGRRSVPA
jgi:hypothetical protein